jgi:DNA-binding XRE family transcriptional regulator
MPGAFGTGPKIKRPPRGHPLCIQLVEHRLERRISQVHAARKIGIDRGTLASWELGRHDPSLRNFVDWAAALNLEIKLENRA